MLVIAALILIGIFALVLGVVAYLRIRQRSNLRRSSLQSLIPYVVTDTPEKDRRSSNPNLETREIPPQTPIISSRSQRDEQSSMFLLETREISPQTLIAFPGISGREKSPHKLGKIAAIFAIILVFVTVIGGGVVVHNYASSFRCTTNSPNLIKLSMYYDIETQDWMKNVVNDFNNQCRGRINVDLQGSTSNQSMQSILDGSIHPDIWSPAGNIWLGLLNEQWQKTHHGSNIISNTATDTPSLVKSPIVIAMWKPMAEALGWPKTPIWWADIAALSTNPRGWAAYGHPEWGDFKFGHTNPNNSNSGLDAVIAENYAAVHKVSGLTLADVNKQTTQDFVTHVESSVIHYGDNIDTFADEMFNKGPSYLSAVVMNESLVAQANSHTKYSHLAYPVVAIYPKEGTFVADHPFAIPQTNWVTPGKKNAALLLQQFLLRPAQQQKALQYYFRPGSLDISNASSAPLDSAHGVDITLPSIKLQYLPPSTTKGVTTSWTGGERNNVNVLLLIDHSGSMNDQVGNTTKIAGAQQGLANFIALMHDRDNVGLTEFNQNEQSLSSLSALGPKRQQMLEAIDGISADGNTRLFNTIADQFKSLQSFSSKNIKAIVVLTDGVDDAKQLNVSQLLPQIITNGNNAGEGIRIFTIAYGDSEGYGVDVTDLQQIAKNTGGQEYPGTPQSITQVYQQITQDL